MVESLPPINSNQQIVEPATGRPKSAFVLLINQLIKAVVSSIKVLTPIVPDPTGTYGDANDTPVITVNEYGVITAIDTVPTSGSGGGGGGPPAWLVTGVGTGSAQVLVLPTSGLALDAVLVFVNGLRWETTEYTIAGANLTLTTNSAGDTIQIVGPLGGSAPFNIVGVGTGVPQNFTLPAAGIPNVAVLVFVNGLRWETTEYTIVGTTLTLTTNSAGDTVQIVGPLGGLTVSGGGSVSAALHWRLRFMQPSHISGSAIGMGLQAVAWRVGGVNKSTGGTASASHTDSGFSTPASAFTGTIAPGNGWYSGTGTTDGYGSWLAYQFTADVLPDEVEFTNLSTFPWTIPGDVAVEYSPDGVFWKTYQTITTGTVTDGVVQTYALANF